MTENMRIKTTEIPNRAKDLYIQLYCEKKGGKTNEIVQSAAQSWLSLSVSKKKQFYKTMSTKTIIRKGQRILKTRPFLKAKDPSNITKSTIEGCSEQKDDNSLASSDADPHQMECGSPNHSFVENTIDLGTQPEPIYCPNNEVEQGVIETRLNEPNTIDDTSSTSSRNILENNDENDKQVCTGTQLEPIIPIIKNGKELYELLNSKGNKVSYESLTPKEKRFYGNAVCRIKRDFVTSYKAYLESLTSRQLFDYYSKIF